MFSIFLLNNITISLFLSFTHTDKHTFFNCTTPGFKLLHLFISAKIQTFQKLLNVIFRSTIMQKNQNRTVIFFLISNFYLTAREKKYTLTLIYFRSSFFRDVFLLYTIICSLDCMRTFSLSNYFYSNCTTKRLKKVFTIFSAYFSFLKILLLNNRKLLFALY